MKFLKLTSVFHDDPIYLNVGHIVAILPAASSKGATCIFTTTDNSDTYYITVETPAEIIEKIEEMSR